MCISSDTSSISSNLIHSYDEQDQPVFPTKVPGITTTVFPIAVDHFNNRRTEFVPELLAIQDCPYNLTIAHSKDTFDRKELALQHVLQYKDEVDVIVGPITSEEASLVGAAGNVLDIPQISYWATSTDLASSLKSFLRTIPSDKLVCI